MALVSLQPRLNLLPPRKLQPRTLSSTLTSLRLPRGRAYDPFGHADALDIQVIEREIANANEYWLPEFHTIVLKTGMREAHKRVALAHAIAHAELGHEDDRPKHETAANRYAALYLINPVEFDAVLTWSDDERVIAEELGVTRRLLTAFLATQGLAG